MAHTKQYGAFRPARLPAGPQTSLGSANNPQRTASTYGVLPSCG